MRPRVLITGGNGYLGGRIAAALDEEGITPVLLVRETRSGAGESGYATVIADVTEKDAVSAAFSAAGKIDAVIHLAAVNEHVCAKDPELAFKVNCFGTQHVLDAAAAHHVPRCIYLSTFHVYGDTASPIIDESTVPNPLHTYGITHLVAEQFCKATAKRTGMSIAIVRLSNGIGAPARAGVDRWSLVMLDLCRQAHTTKRLVLQTSGAQKRNFVSIDDAAQAIIILLRADGSALKEPVFNVGSDALVSIADIAQVIAEEHASLYGRALPIEAPHATPHAPDTSFSFRFDRIRALGFRPQTDIRHEARSVLRFCERFRQ
jgi:UDP-glucose 4-epimerase